MDMTYNGVRQMLRRV